MKTRNSGRSLAILASAAFALATITSDIQARAGSGRQAQAAGAPQTQPAAKPAIPEPSPFLSARDKELLAEALRLKQILGDEVWPGFGSAAIPVIIYNEGYEFLTGPVNPLPRPPWVVVEKDDFLGQPTTGARPRILRPSPSTWGSNGRAA